MEDITLPLGQDAASTRETLRRPPNLERAEILRRLVEIRDYGPLDMDAFFAKVETMSAAQIATAIIAALDWVQKDGGHEPLTHRLQILALNLKNLH
jgi:serine kinase of HPr protein (carbohydrate metabolism regulator)